MAERFSGDVSFLGEKPRWSIDSMASPQSNRSQLRPTLECLEYLSNQQPTHTHESACVRIKGPRVYNHVTRYLRERDEVDVMCSGSEGFAAKGDCCVQAHVHVRERKACGALGDFFQAANAATVVLSSRGVKMHAGILQCERAPDMWAATSAHASTSVSH